MCTRELGWLKVMRSRTKAHISFLRDFFQNLKNPESLHGKIIRGFLWVSIFVFFGKLAGAAKEMAVAWRFGVDEKVDAYVFVFSLANWPISIWFSILTVVLIPLVVKMKNENSERLPLFFSELFGFSLGAGVVLGLLAWFVLPFVLHSEWLGLSEKALHASLSMVFGMSLLIPLGAIISLLSAFLLAKGNHYNTLFEAVPALALLGVLLLPGEWVSAPLVWGTVLGFILHVSVLMALLFFRKELVAPSFMQRSPAWKLFWQSIGVLVLGQVLMSITSLVDQFFAMRMDVGALAGLSYANRVLSLLLGMGALAISRATLPVFSEWYAQRQNAAKHLAVYWAVMMLVGGALVLLVAWFVSPYAISFLFERGAFGEDDVALVTSMLRIGLLQLPFYFAALVFVSSIAAKGRHQMIALSGACCLAYKVICAVPLVNLYGINGLIGSTAIMYLLSMVTLFFFDKHAVLRKGY